MANVFVYPVSCCPFMVSLKQPVNGTLRLCGGTVLTTTLTLTAAHCLVYGTNDLILNFGSVHLFGDGIYYSASKLYLHDDFDEITLENDIGLVSIYPRTLKFDSHIQPVKLPSAELKLQSTTLVTIYGWGATSEEKSFSNILQTTRLPLMKRNICQNLLDGWVPRKTFCLGYFTGHVDACMGDSGGPAILHGVQIGIISFGEGCGEPMKPGVYTDLTQYVHWIRNFTEQL